MNAVSAYRIKEMQDWAAEHAATAREERDLKPYKDWERVCRYHQKASAHWYETVRIAMGIREG